MCLHLGVSFSFSQLFLIFSRALDTASILGGNEVLVAQLLKDQESRSFNPDEKLVIQWALDLLWNESPLVETQAYFSQMLLLDIKKDLPSIYLAKSKADGHKFKAKV